MAAAQASNHMIEQIKNATGLAEVAVAESIELTPVMVLAASLLYMMASDGHIEDEESSQLQSVIGGNEDLLSYAVAYVHRVPVAEFLKLAPPVLSTQDKLCILANVCDSMLADGNCDPTELDLFEKFQSAFGVGVDAFKPYFKIIQLKNDKNVLGPFAAIEDGPPLLTPHLALAVSLIYMMSADGSLGQEEIGQLETVIGEFDGLQQAALGYVRTVKREDFFIQARPILNRKQILCILTNVCDSMTADGVVAVIEDKLFVRMLSAFGLRDTEFDQYQKVLETKNFKPFDISKFVNKTSHGRTAGNGEAGGEVFEMSEEDSELGVEVRRTMHDNLERVQHDFGSDANVIQVNHNATDDLNIQQVDAVKPANNAQWISGKPAHQNRAALDETPHSDSRLRIDNDPTTANMQDLGITAIASNVQEVTEVDALVSNRQPIDVDTQAEHSEVLPPEVRMQNLFEDIEVLTQQLDTFEAKNKLILEQARQARLLKETQRLQAEEEKAANQAALAAQAARQSTGLAKTHVQTNLQAVGVDAIGRNIQTIGADSLATNWQTLSPKVTPHDIDLSRDAANTEFLGDTASESLSELSLDGGLTQGPSGPQTSRASSTVGSEVPSLSEARLKRAQGHKTVPRAHNYKMHARVAVTFLVLSAWSSNIAAIHRDNPQTSFGKLERLSDLHTIAAPVKAL